MADIDISEAPLRPATSETALQAVVAASSGVLAAKRTGPPELVAHAEKDLQAAIDGARDTGVQWGQIGSTLGIARGNAYQRYRKKLPRKSFETNDGRRARIA